MITYFFTAVFLAINHWFWVAAVAEAGDEFSIIYNFITIFVNHVYVSNFVFHCTQIN